MKKQLDNARNIIKKKYKKIDIILNCSVSQNYLTFERQTFKSFSNSLVINVAGTFLIIKKFLFLLKKSKNPNIINMGSIYGLVGGDPSVYPNNKLRTSDVYAASKAAIIHLSKYYAIHLSKYNIRVNCVSPGGIFNQQDKKLIKNYNKKTPLGRMASIDEVLEGIKFFFR